jgi:hypothetical protein
VTALNQKEQAKLRRIRKMVTKTHWMQGDFSERGEDGKPRYCLVGFVNLVAGIDDHHLGSELSDEEMAGEVSDDKKIRLRRHLLSALEDAVRKYAKRRTRYNSLRDYINGQSGIEWFNDYRETEREDILNVIDLALGEKS